MVHLLCLKEKNLVNHNKHFYSERICYVTVSTRNIPGVSQETVQTKTLSQPSFQQCNNVSMTKIRLKLKVHRYIDANAHFRSDVFIYVLYFFLNADTINKYCG